MTRPEATSSPPGDRLAQAWERRDVEALVTLMSPEVKLHSPLLRTSFRGRQAVRDLYSVLFDVLGPVRFIEDFHADGRRMFVWEARTRRGVIEGTDLVRFGADGLIKEVRVFIRPLAGIGAFARLTGEPLASRRSRARGAIARVLTAPLGPLFSALDRVAPRLVPMGSHAASHQQDPPIARRNGAQHG
ncbi:MAG TPA: nuclear transport factor 2 family protein [Acidimicrobiales bacterium]|nr:nuclear transport factor 2 family protein [Acidimicrobiales bacterium]